mmetsp:Transcript_11098/g.29435  ORF Transcript_11098/g.29435 Transcript_11098/m.29435 type:complete len:207 (+) Transcript_11098:413-1033(+)
MAQPPPSATAGPWAPQCWPTSSVPGKNVPILFDVAFATRSPSRPVGTMDTAWPPRSWVPQSGAERTLATNDFAATGFAVIGPQEAARAASAPNVHACRPAKTRPNELAPELCAHGAMEPCCSGQTISLALCAALELGAVVVAVDHVELFGWSPEQGALFFSFCKSSRCEDMYSCERTSSTVGRRVMSGVRMRLSKLRAPSDARSGT